MKEKIKWLLLTNYVHKRLVDEEDCLRTGLYSWIPVFEGEVRRFKDVDPSEYENYDIIQVNLSAQDVHILGEVREKIGWDSKTKLVANNDYTLELWPKSFEYLPTFKRELQYADMIFGTEPLQVGALEVLLGRKVHLITHPCFVKRLKTLRPRQRKNVISVVSHRYDAHHIVPSIAVSNLGVETQLIGYDDTADPHKHVTVTCYNDVILGKNYMDFCDILMESRVVVDPFTLTSQSRVGWDCAALGVPMVGSDRNYSVRRCFPYTMASPFDVKKIRELTKRLLFDEEFRQKVITHAQQEVEYVSYENSRQKYLDALKEGSPKIVV
jgi:hypothetical protein